MLRIQLLLAGTVLALLLAMAGLAGHRLLTTLGATAPIAIIVSASFVALRLLAPFRCQQQTDCPPDALDRSLALLHIVAVTHLPLPSAMSPMALDNDLIAALRAALPLLVAVVTELALVACQQTLAPNIRAALAADLAVAQWFANRRIEVERELLETLSKNAANDAGLRHRLERLTRRFEHEVAARLPPPNDQPTPPPPTEHIA